MVTMKNKLKRQNPNMSEDLIMQTMVHEATGWARGTNGTQFGKSCGVGLWATEWRRDDMN